MTKTCILQELSEKQTDGCETDSPHMQSNWDAPQKDQCKFGVSPYSFPIIPLCTISPTSLQPHIGVGL